MTEIAGGRSDKGTKNVIWQYDCCSSLHTVLMAIRRTQVAKRSEKPNMRQRRRVVGAVNPMRMDGTIDEARRKVIIRSSQTVKEFDKKTRTCKARGTEMDVVREIDNFG
jgi:hypothetical protein